MSGFLRRFSSAYRTAVAHEAAGEYIEAAKPTHCAMSDTKSPRCTFWKAGRRGGARSAAAELLVAVHLLIDDGDAPKSLIKRLWRCALRVVRSRDLVDSDHELWSMPRGCSPNRRAEPGGGSAGARRRHRASRGAWQQAGEVERVEAAFGASAKTPAGAAGTRTVCELRNERCGSGNATRHSRTCARSSKWPVRGVNRSGFSMSCHGGFRKPAR